MQLGGTSRLLCALGMDVAVCRRKEAEIVILASDPTTHAEVPWSWENQLFAMLKSLSRVMQRDDDDGGVQHRGIEDDAGALQHQIVLLTHRPAQVKDADKHDLKSVGADVGDTSQDIPATSQAMFHQVHTPRQEPDTSSKLDGVQECEINARRNTFSGSVLSGSHRQGTTKCVQSQGSARLMRRNSFSGSESSGSFQ